MDERKGRRLNLFDLLLVVLAVAVVAAAAAFQHQQRQLDAAEAGKNLNEVLESTQVRFVLQLRELSGEVAQSVQPGDVLYEHSKHLELGTVEAVTVSPGQETVLNEQTGEYVTVDIPDKYTADITVVSQGSQSEKRIATSSDYNVRVGTGLRVYGPGYYGGGYIISVDRG